jgi:membrane-associated phospholipid phosphatase
VPVLIVAGSVAASRVVLGLHWLSDVLVGAFVGALIGTSVWLALPP